jgi:hypothetical protein
MPSQDSTSVRRRNRSQDGTGHQGKGNQQMRRAFLLGAAIVFVGVAAIGLVDPASSPAHQSGCHRWHSCPSDTGSYTCGDLGYACQYPSDPTSTYTDPYTYTPTTPTFIDKNCDDFSSQQAAQAYFDANPGDPSHLDADKDGKACEALSYTATGYSAPECDDELDNDYDGKIDLNDPDCESATWDHEDASACTLALRSRNKARRAVRSARRMLRSTRGARHARYRRVLRRRTAKLASAQARAMRICFPPPPQTIAESGPSTVVAPVTPSPPATPTPPSPTADAQSLATPEDSPLGVALTGAVASGRSASFAITSSTYYGVLSGTAPNVFYTPDPNYFGTDSFAFKVNDGSSDSPVALVNITVEPVNDPPSFDLPSSPDQHVTDNGGSQSVPNFAANIGAGPPNETGQSASFTVSNDNASLFEAPPGIDQTGTLTYTPASGQTGSATVSVALVDDGGTSLGGSDTSPIKTFTITVTPQPTADQQSVTTLEDMPLPITLTGTVPQGRLPSFFVTSSTYYGTLGGTEPSVVYSPDSDYFGNDVFWFKVNDGFSDSQPAPISITVEPVNDVPTFDLPATPDQSVASDAGAQSISGFATSISSGPSNEAGQSVSFVVSNDNNALFDVQPTIEQSGILTYSPAPGQVGSATVSVTLVDDGGTSNGGSDTSSEKSFPITVQPPASP